RQLGGGQTECFAREFFADAFHFVDDLAGLNFRDPELGIAFTITHTDFRRLLRDGLIGENANPDTAAPFDVAVDRTTSGFDLAGRQASAASGLKAELAERHLRTASRQAGVTAFVLFAILSS